MLEKLIKVKILRPVGAWTQGQEVEVTEAQANAMCTIRKSHNGYEAIDYRTAITIEELDKIKAIPIDMGGLSLDEAQALGIRNIVETPKSELDKPFHPGFVETKAATEGASALQSEELNAKTKKRSAATAS